jgi:hypothetical protein
MQICVQIIYKKNFFSKLNKFYKMLVQQRQVGSKGLFYVKENDNIMAKMTYSMTGTELMIIDYT